MLRLLLASHLLAAPMCSTEFMDRLAQDYLYEARHCEKAARLPNRKCLHLEMLGIVEGCNRGWPGDAEAPLRCFAALLTESGGNTDHNSDPKREHTTGPFCTTTWEARETCRILAIPCPKHGWDIWDKLENDPEWAAMVGVLTLWRYQQAAHGDFVLGLTSFKYGPTKLLRLVRQLGDKPVTELGEWKKFSSAFDRTFCLRDRILNHAERDCGCTH